MNHEFLFHEVYGVYFQAVSKLIECVLKHPMDMSKAKEVIRDVMYKETDWQLLRAIANETYGEVVCPAQDGQRLKTDLKHHPDLPLTALEKRWLKTISLDPRVALFNFEYPGLDQVEPLYRSEDLYYCGTYAFGDPYESESYRQFFKRILTALRAQFYLDIRYEAVSGRIIEGKFEPQRLEYSMKEDRFRLHGILEGKRYTFNLYRILDCQIGGKNEHPEEERKDQEAFVEVELVNRRKALERFLLYFSTFRKTTENLGDDRFKIRIRYPKSDETEILINILSFIPMVNVTGPKYMRELFVARLKKQKELFGILD